MKQSEHKEKIKSELKAMGFGDTNDLVVTVIGNFYIIIYLSTQVRVVIEAYGSGSQNVILEQFKKSYSNTTSKELIEVSEMYIRKCKAFNETK